MLPRLKETLTENNLGIYAQGKNQHPAGELDLDSVPTKKALEQMLKGAQFVAEANKEGHLDAVAMLGYELPHTIVLTYQFYMIVNKKSPYHFPEE